MAFHLSSLFAVNVLSSIILTLALAWIGVRGRKHMVWWVFGFLLHAWSYLLFIGRDDLPAVLAIAAGNTALSASLAAFCQGIYTFQGRATPRWNWLPVAVMAAVMPFIVHQMTPRILVSGVVLGAQSIMAAQAIWRQRHQTAGRGQYILLAAVMVLCAIMVMRLLSMHAVNLNSADSVDHLPLHGFMFLLATQIPLLLAVGMTLMTQERIEHSLSDREQQYRQLLQSANEGIAVTQDGILVLSNPAMTELLGHSAQQLQHRHFVEWVSTDHRKLVQDHQRQHQSGQRTDQHHEAQVITAHKGLRWFEFSGGPFIWHGRPAALTFVTDVTDRKALAARIERMAYHDTLTELPNRRLLSDHIRLALAHQKRSGHHSALIYLDLDNFKPLNDEHGHAMGDLLLMEVAMRLKQSVREADTVARVGGDEFVVLLSNLPESTVEAQHDAMFVAHKILNQLSEPYVLTSVQEDGLEITITHHCSASIGVTVFQYHDGPDAILLSRADEAMYRAKEAGRGTVRLHESPLS